MRHTAFAETVRAGGYAGSSSPETAVSVRKQGEHCTVKSGSNAETGACSFKLGKKQEGILKVGMDQCPLATPQSPSSIRVTPYLNIVYVIVHFIKFHF